MKYETARNLIFDYFIKEKELNDINIEIDRFKRNIPHDNEHASEFVMIQMDKEIVKKDIIVDEMKLLKDEIESLLRVFK